MTDDENDIALEYDKEAKGFDLRLTDDGCDLLPAVNLRNAAGICIFSERRTNADDPVPNMAGYPGDALDDIDESNLGSKLWLALRGKATDDKLPVFKQYVEESLQWMIDDGIASAVNVNAFYSGTPGERLNLNIEIVRLTGENLQFAYVWDQPLLRNG